LETLKNSSDFKKVYKGHKFYTQAFCVHYVKTTTHNPPLFGFTISKKTVSKKAVIRNLIRRRIKNCLIEHFDFHCFNGYEFILTAIKETKNIPWTGYINSVKKMQKTVQSYVIKSE
jgi:ribonuclease P protein component